MKIAKTILLVVVIPLIFLWIGYIIQKKDREPTFHVEPIKTILVDHRNIDVAPIHILRRDGKPIREDVLLSTFYFFNQGKLTIKPDNVYEPIRIKLSDSTDQILQVRVLKTSREVSGINVKLDSTTNSIHVNFKALEEDDGFAAQIIYEGDVNTELIISGGIDEVKKFETSVHYSFWIWETVGIVILILLMLMLEGILTPRIGKKEKQIPIKTVLVTLAVILTVGACVYYFMIYPTEGKNTKVPETIQL
jgi:hypothetical protein